MPSIVRREYRQPRTARLHAVPPAPRRPVAIGETPLGRLSGLAWQTRWATAVRRSIDGISSAGGPRFPPATSPADGANARSAFWSFSPAFNTPSLLNRFQHRKREQHAEARLLVRQRRLR